MRVKNVNLKFYVLNHDFNNDSIYYINVMTAIDLEDLRKKIKKGDVYDFDSLKEYLNREFIYRYWCRCEYEVYIGGLSSKAENYEKWDVYMQLKPNLDLITNYVISECKIDFKKEK